VGGVWTVSPDTPVEGAAIQLSVPAYDPNKGAVAPVEGGDITVEVGDDGVTIRGNPPGMRDLARWCMVLADPDAPDGVHAHLDPGIVPLTSDSLPLLLERGTTEGSK
jgi:hypothetical protein